MKRKVFSLALKDDRVEQCVQSLVGVNSKCGVQTTKAQKSVNSRGLSAIPLPLSGCENTAHTNSNG